MARRELQAHADQFLSVARQHPECRDGRLATLEDESVAVELDLNVEMPQHIKIEGVSENGIYATETVTVKLDTTYPWSPPTFYLRAGFPRDLPHLQPGQLDERPRPCLVDGDPLEYFFQFNLEVGVFQLITQMVLWLQHAADSTLMNPTQGWEPTLRQGLTNLLTLDAETARATVDRDGGLRFYSAQYCRLGSNDAKLADHATALIAASTRPVSLDRANKELFMSRRYDNKTFGATVCCVIWPEKLPSGAPFVFDQYAPETVNTVRALRNRAAEVGCGVFFESAIASLERWLRGRELFEPIPIAIVLCVRRPFSLMNSSSQIELLPYVVELAAKRGSAKPFQQTEAEPVAPAMQVDVPNAALLQRLSGAPDIGSVAVFGCGSVGSKIAMHLARCGIRVPVVSDKSVLLPHNLARHALARPPLPVSKGHELAIEIAYLGQSAEVHDGDLALDLLTRNSFCSLVGKKADYVLNTTASLSVRERLSSLTLQELPSRIAECALFGRGHGAFLLLEGRERNPTSWDLVAELYATTNSDRLRFLLFDPAHGLSEIQVGQGCGSLTMQMTDMRLSAMTGAIGEALLDAGCDSGENGLIVTGSTVGNSSDTHWAKQTVPPFEIVPIESKVNDWTLRLSQRVLEKIREDIARYKTVETGGVLLGLCSARLKTITVVDVLPAPTDSQRLTDRFILGREGLKKAIHARHRSSGCTLFDVGTWHSHLHDQGPSPLDQRTARDLAKERPPPSILLIVTPNRLHALMHTVAAA